MPTEGSQITWQ